MGFFYYHIRPQAPTLTRRRFGGVGQFLFQARDLVLVEIGEVGWIGAKDASTGGPVQPSLRRRSGRSDAASLRLDRHEERRCIGGDLAGNSDL
jgi:hypothetical protein